MDPPTSHTQGVIQTSPDLPGDCRASQERGLCSWESRQARGCRLCSTLSILPTNPPPKALPAAPIRRDAARRIPAPARRAVRTPGIKEHPCYQEMLSHILQHCLCHIKLILRRWLRDAFPRGAAPCQAAEIHLPSPDIQEAAGLGSAGQGQQGRDEPGQQWGDAGSACPTPTPQPHSLVHLQRFPARIPKIPRVSHRLSQQAHPSLMKGNIIPVYRGRNSSLHQQPGPVATSPGQPGPAWDSTKPVQIPEPPTAPHWSQNRVWEGE